MKLKRWFFLFVLLSIVWITQSNASRISTVPVPGTKSLGVHLNEINSNFVELYRLIYLSEPGFTGLSGAIITSGVINEARIDAALVRTSAMNTALSGKLNIPTGDGSLFLSNDGTYKSVGAGGSDYDLNDDNYIDVGFIPASIARLTNLPVAGTDYLSPAAVSTAITNGITGKQNADLDLDDLADGSLTGSKIGTGIIATYITTGTLPDAVIPSGITRDSELTTALGSYTTTSALTTLLSGKQNADADLTTFAGITPSANIISLLGSANYASIRALLDLEPGTDFYNTIMIDALIASTQEADPDLTDLADGSLTGSKVGPGISATNVTTGTLPDAVIPSAVTRDSELTTALGSYTTTSALTTLLSGKMGTATGTPDGTKFLRDDMTWQIVSAGGGDDWDSTNDSIIDIGYLPTALIVESELTTTLSNYVLTSALTTALGSYVTTGSAASFSSVTTTGPISSTGGADGTRGIWWTNPNTVAETMTQPFGIYPTNTGIHAKWTDGSAVEHDIVIGTGGTGTSVYVDGASVDTPNFDSTGDIDVVATGSNVAANVKDDVLTLDNLTTGSVVTSGETPISNDTSIMTTASVMNYINTQVDHLVNMKLADADFTIGNYLNPVSSPAAVSTAAYTVSGNVYDNGTTPTVEVSLNNGAYSAAIVAGTTSPWTWSRALTLISGSNTIDTRITNSDTEIVQLPQVVVNYTVPDTTNPVVGVITPSTLTHDGTGATLTATIASITEANEDDREWSLYNVTDATQGTWTVFTGLSISGITIPADTDTYRIDVRVTDLAGNVGTASSANIVYDAGGCESNITVIGQGSIAEGTVANAEEYGNYVHWSRYVASDTCTIDRLHTWLQNSGSTAYNVRMGIFSSSAGEPSVQLGITPETATAGSGAAQDLSCTLSTPVEVVSGTTYWIAEWMSTTATGRYYFEYLESTTAEAGYQAATYSSTGNFPSPARTAWNNKFIFYGVTE